MDSLSLLTDTAVIFFVFVISFIVSSQIIIFIKTKASGWKPPSLQTFARNTKETSMSFCSAKEMVERYRLRISYYCFPRSVCISGLTTTLLAHHVFKIIPSLMFILMMTIFLFVLFLYSIENKSDLP